MTGSIPPNLIMSLVFGVGQIVVGGWLVWYELAPRAWRKPNHWRDWRAMLAAAAGAWFFVSGVCELIVSGMETNRLSGGSLSLVTFNSTRSAADATLYAVTAALAVALIAYGVVLLASKRQASPTNESERAQ